MTGDCKVCARVIPIFAVTRTPYMNSRLPAEVILGALESVVTCSKGFIFVGEERNSLLQFLKNTY